MRLRCLLAAGAALVAAKTGLTPEPMYEIDAVCSDWWHADGCFDPANPDVDRQWPSDDIEAIFTAALEGREPGACASCGFGSNVATLPGAVDTSTDCVQCEPPYQLIRLYEDCSGICVDAKTKDNLITAGVQFPFNPWDDEGGVCKPWPWPQCLDGTLRPTPRPTSKPTDDECADKYHVEGCFDPSEDVTTFPASFAGLMIAALEGRDLGQCFGCGYGPIEDVGGVSSFCLACEEGFELVRIWENCRGFCVDPLTKANLENFWPEPPYNPWDDPAGACTPDPCAPATPEPETEAPTGEPTDAPTVAAPPPPPPLCDTIRCREPPFEPGSLCDLCFGGSAAPTREPTPPPTYGPPVPTTVVVPWIIPVADQAITVDPSSKVVFEWPSVHNVWEMPNKAAYDACDFSTAKQTCPVAVGGSCTIDAPASGQTKYYACQVGPHCQRGQVVAITGAAAPGTDHSFSDSVPGTDDDRQGCEPFCGDNPQGSLSSCNDYCFEDSDCVSSSSCPKCVDYGDGVRKWCKPPPTPKPTPPPTDAPPVIVPWVIPVVDQAITVDPSAKITFERPSIAYNIWEMPSKAAYDACDFRAATEVFPGSALGRPLTIDAPAVGETKYYACLETCRLGQIVAITGAAAPGTESTDDDRQGCFPFCGDKSDAPPPTPKPTTTLPKGGKADKDEDESDGASGRALSASGLVVAVAAAPIALLVA